MKKPIRTGRFLKVPRIPKIKRITRRTEGFMSLETGDKVYYVENGPSDTGVIEEVAGNEPYPYLVRWDNKLQPNDLERDWHAEHQIRKIEDAKD
jgi:hypothetical protein